LATFAFGIWGIHINWVYGQTAAQGSCNLPYIINLITADSSIGVIIAALLCVLISYGVASTRMNKLEFIMTILINVIRIIFSLFVSNGLLIATAVAYYTGQCVCQIFLLLTCKLDTTLP
jgi:hypothetical protein